PGPAPAFLLSGGVSVAAGPSAPRLVIEAPDVTVEIENCIIGGIRAADAASVSVSGSIIDASGDAEGAYSGLPGYDAGAPLTIENSTVIGKVHTFTMDSASNPIFLARLDPFDSPPSSWQAPVMAERLQEGCVRYSFVPPGSLLPRQFQC